MQNRACSPKRQSCPSSRAAPRSAEVMGSIGGVESRPQSSMTKEMAQESRASQSSRLPKGDRSSVTPQPTKGPSQVYVRTPVCHLPLWDSVDYVYQHDTFAILDWLSLVSVSKYDLACVKPTLQQTSILQHIQMVLDKLSIGVPLCFRISTHCV